MNYDYIKTGDLLFLDGDKWIAKQIKKAQKAKENKYYKLNHVGIFVWMDDILCVAEEDYPGQFDINPFIEEYVIPGHKIYLGAIVNQELTEKQIDKFNLEMLKEASEDRFTNYAYVDILVFKINSLWFKWTGRDTWWGRKKNKKGRYTCSQRTAKFLQKYFSICLEKPYFQWTPADIADDKNIIINKIKY